MIEIDESTFTANSAGDGGALYVQRSFINVRDSSFSENSARYDGRDIDANSGSAVNFNNSEFVSSVAERNGGALSLIGDCNLKIHNCIFVGCISAVEGGAIHLGQSNAIVMNSTFQSSMCFENGGVLNAHNSSIQIESSNFVNNVAKGGAIYATTGSIYEVEKSTFRYNRVVNNSGGALYCVLSSYCKISDSNFTLNSGNSRGGAIYNKEMSKVNIVSSSFITNRAIQGGALAARDMGTITLDNYIIDASPQQSVVIHDN